MNAPLHTEVYKGFTISFHRENEDTDPRDHLDDAAGYVSGDAENDHETIVQIASGDLDWFCAKVTASLNGIVLAEDYLGCCCYFDPMDFVRGGAGDYYADMREDVVSRAGAVLADAMAAAVKQPEYDQ